jgi:hypothetical protein
MSSRKSCIRTTFGAEIAERLNQEGLKLRWEKVHRPKFTKLHGAIMLT